MALCCRTPQLRGSPGTGKSLSFVMVHPGHRSRFRNLIREIYLMNTEYTKTRIEKFSVAWISLAFIFAFAASAGWITTLLGGDCTVIKESETQECFIYLSKLDKNFDYMYCLVALLAVGNYFFPNRGGRKVARDAILGVLLFGLALSLARALFTSEGAVGFLIALIPSAVETLLVFLILRERKQSFGFWLANVFESPT